MSDRDCPHGRQIGKCAECDVARLEAENEALRAAIEKETAARREAQIRLEAAYEARNRAGIEFRRQSAKENAELVEALRQTRAALVGIGIVGQIDGHDVVRRESVIEMAERAAIRSRT